MMVGGVAWFSGLHHCLPIQGPVVQIPLRVTLSVLFFVFENNCVLKKDPSLWDKIIWMMDDHGRKYVVVDIKIRKRGQEWPILKICHVIFF